MRLADLLPTFILLAATTSAWPAEPNPLDLVNRESLPLLHRQVHKDAQKQDTASSSAVERKKTTIAASSTAGSGRASSTEIGKGTTTKDADKHTRTTSKYETTKTFSDVLPPGGVSMITPAAILGPQYYKIGNSDVTEYVTFAWNYTSLSVTPSAVDVLASCALNSATYTIALNQSIAGPTQTVLWDTGEFQRTASVPLAVASYTLIVYDSDSSPNAIPRAGYLGTSNQMVFGMYSPKVPVAMTEIVCATCNSAGSLERQTIGFLFGLVLVTVASFGWFTGVAGLW